MIASTQDSLKQVNDILGTNITGISEETIAALFLAVAARLPELKKPEAVQPTTETLG